MGTKVINMVYDLKHTLSELKKRSIKLLEKGHKKLFIVMVFKIRSPTLTEYPYYVACFTQANNMKEVEKALKVYEEIFRGEKLVDFEIKVNHQWENPKPTLKNIDEVMKKIEEIGKEFEEKIAKKLPEKLRKKPITPLDAPISVYIIFKENKQTFGIEVTEDYYRIDREILEYLTDSLPPTSKIQGYQVEPHELMLKEPEIEDYYIEEGHVIVELKTEFDKTKT